MTRLLSAIFVFATPWLLAAADEEVIKELKVLQGTWKTVEVEAGGMKLPKDAIPEFLFIVGEGGKSTGKMGPVEYQSLMTVDPTKSPKTIDNAHETGTQKGKKQLGIYKVEGGKWIVCMTAPGAAESDRPASFDTSKNAKCILFTFELVREEKKP